MATVQCWARPTQNSRAELLSAKLLKLHCTAFCILKDLGIIFQLPPRCLDFFGIAHALVTSKLDYSNGLSTNQLAKLQCVQNSATHIISRVSRQSHRDSHVPPVQYTCFYMPGYTNGCQKGRQTHKSRNIEVGEYIRYARQDQTNVNI